MSFFFEKTLKTAISIAMSKKFENYFFGTSNRRILHLTSMKMCGKNFRNFDCTNCKIFVIKVKKTKISAHCRTS